MPAWVEDGVAPTFTLPAERGYRCVSNDANLHAGNLRGWSQLYDQLSSGAFEGAIQGVFLDAAHVFRERTSARLRQSCMVRSDAWWFGIPMCDQSSFRLDARTIDDGAVAVRRGRRSFELVTPSSFDILGVVVDRQKLAPYLCALDAPEVLQADRDVLAMQPEARSRLRMLIQNLLGEVGQRPELMEHGTARRGMETSLLEALAAACVEQRGAQTLGKTALQRTRLVRDVREYLLRERQNLVSVAELCQRFAVSRRILQYAFEEVLGMGPNAYLRMLRLNGVRRDLTRRDGGDISVQQVAADWGFWHLSQFAKDYRQHFHELPSATLKRGREA